MYPLSDQLLITAASDSFGPYLLAWLGALDANWPGHPPVRVYDLGLGQHYRSILDRHKIPVTEVPAFCPHWRRHFTWKFWCWNDAPARDIFYMDAGSVVLHPIPEVMDWIRNVGYFTVPTYHPMTENASEAACEGCGVEAAFRDSKVTLAGGIVGFRKEGKIRELLKEGLEIACNERYIEATDPWHRHDQAILSLLLYRDLKAPMLADGLIYCSWKSSQQVAGQKIWVHRRHLSGQDQQMLAERIGQGPRRYSIEPFEVAAAAKERRMNAGLKPLIKRILRKIARRDRRAKQPTNVQPKIYDGIRD